MRTDDPGFLDVKLAVIAIHGDPWVEGLTALGDVIAAEETSGWIHKQVRTTAVLGGLTIRVSGYVGSPTANMQVALVGADRVISDGQTEIPDFTLANAPRMVGPPGRETWLTALKDVLREAAKG
jgi:hypothetical protein